MSSVQWDHTVHYVNNLDAVIAQLSQYGILAFHGGTHPRWGTCNALSYFGLAYHEFLAIENLSLAQQTDRDNLVVHDAVQALPDHQVLSRVALRTTDIVSVYYRLKQQGIEVAPIITGKRLDKQGRPVEWKMMTPGGSFQGLRYPFIIEWQETDEQRLEHLHQQGIIQPHPAGEVALSAARPLWPPIISAREPNNPQTSPIRETAPAPRRICAGTIIFCACITDAP